MLHIIKCRKITTILWVLSLFSLFQPTFAQEFTSALLLNYDTATFYLGYSGSTVPTQTSVTITKTGIIQSVAFDLTTTNSSNGILTCYSEHKVCEVEVYSLLSVNNAEFWTGEVTVGFRVDPGHTYRTVLYVGRNIIWPRTSITSSSSLTNFASLEPTFGGFNVNNFGYTSTPTAINAYVASNSLVGLVLSFETGSQTFGTTSSGAQGNEAFSGSVTAITTYRNPNGAVCGIRIAHGVTELVHGCSDNEQLVEISENYAFAGFSALQSGDGSGDFVLYPLQYQLLHPRVVSWTATDRSISFQFNVFWPTTDVSVGYSSRSSRNTTDLLSSLIYVTNTPFTHTLSGVTVSDVNSFPFTSSVEIDSNLMPCSPMFIQLESVSTNNRAFQLKQDYYAWTYGYEVTNTSTVQIAATVTGTTYTSQPRYYQQLLDTNGQEQCDQIFPQSFGISSSELYVNGFLLGSSVSFTGSATDLSGKVINKVTVYYDATTDSLNGLDLFWNNYTYGTIGTQSGGTSVDLDFSSSGGGVGRVLWYIESVFSGSTTQELKFYWARAREPVLVEIGDVDDGEGYQSTLFSTSTKYPDASLKRVLWYNPADYSSSVDFHIDGYFFGSTNDFLSNYPVSQSRGSDGSAYLYHLVAGTDYDYQITGLFDYTPQTGQPITTYYSATGTGEFRTASGVQIQCTEAGSMQLQVNFEALPEVTVRKSSTSSVDMGDSSNVATNISSAEEIQSTWLKQSHFIYQDSPINPDFSAFPRKVLVYWDNSGSCIRGLALVYVDRDQNEENVWIAGSQADYNNSSPQNREEVDWSGMVDDFTNVSTSVYYSSASNCLSGIQFRSDSNTDISGCLGPSVTCETLAFSQPSSSVGDPSFYLYSLTVGTGVNGDFIYNISGQYASIDFPSLLSLDRECNLTFSMYPFFIRDSYYSLSFDLTQDTLTCGTLREVVDLQATNGTTVNVLYQQKITRLRDDPNSKALTSQSQATITRFNNWHVPAYCYYNAEGQETGQVRTVQEADQAAYGTNQFQFSMDVYVDDTYQEQYGAEAPHLILGEPIYVMVRGDFSLANWVVVASRCWATRTSNPDDDSYFTIQSDTCKVDATFGRDSPAPAIARSDTFHFDAFAWFNESEQEASTGTVFLHCDVRTCPPDQTENFCAIKDPVTECGSTSRRRRSLIEEVDDDSPPKGSRKATVHRRQPIYVIKPPKEIPVERGRFSKTRVVDPNLATPAEQLSNFQASFAFLFLLFTFSLTVALSIRLLRRHRSSRALLICSNCVPVSIMDKMNFSHNHKSSSHSFHSCKFH